MFVYRNRPAHMSHKWPMRNNVFRILSCIKPVISGNRADYDLI